MKHTWRKFYLWLTATAVIILLGACAAPNAKLPVEDSGGQLSQVADTYETLDDLYIEVAERVPGFGGLFYEGADLGALNGVQSDRLKIYIKGMSELSAAQRTDQEEDTLTALVEVLGPAFVDIASTQLGIPDNQVSASNTDAVVSTLEAKTDLIPAQYDYLELTSWYEKMRGKGLSGIVMNDINEGKNRIELGIENESFRAPLKKRLDELGIPNGLVIITVVGKAEDLLSLRNKWRPVPGGIKITRSRDNATCTIGFVAQHGGDVGFVTNSHCTYNTQTRGGNDNTRFHNDLSTMSGTLVGYEHIDPLYNSCTDFGGQSAYCRRSDSAFVKFNSATSYKLGYIAKPLKRALGFANDNTIVSSDPSKRFLRITSERHLTQQSEIIDKIGQSSGWTYGRITNTCTGFRSGRFYWPCTNYANTHIDPGDSGSTVFSYRSGSSSITLLGTAHGRVSGTGQLVFSDMAAVEGDLGSLRTY